MKNYKILINGMTLELNEMDMMKIHQYYEVQCTADFLRENHSWNEEKIQWIANETREIMADYNIVEEEAIDIAITRYEEKYE